MEESVLKRYKDAARRIDKNLCCPTSYDPEYLKVIPEEIIHKDYGCGDPSSHVKRGETVLDLGSGAGKLCYIIAQIVGPSGRVIGVDMNDEMLSLARKYQNEIAEKLGYSNVEFRKARIQNLRLDLEKVDNYLKEYPIKSSEDLIIFDTFCKRLESEAPILQDNSIDVVVSNCVLNLVRKDDRERLFREITRLLKQNGRAVISDIVADMDVPEYMQEDPELWSGCVSGAMREDRFFKAFEDAGFYGIKILKWSENPWKVVDGIEFRSVTVVAYKGEKGKGDACLDRDHSVIYRGPFRKIEDDNGHSYPRGRRTPVSEETFNILTQDPYSEYFIFIDSDKSHHTVSSPEGGKSICCHSKAIEERPYHDGVFESFNERLKRYDVVLKKEGIKVVQVNLGNYCNQTCLHCHVEASPAGRLMERPVLEKVIAFLRRNQGLELDITGGAPELHPDIEYLIKKSANFVNKISLRTNITALLERHQLIGLLRETGVEIIGSLPDISKDNTDYIRGKGVFERSIQALRLLNENAYGTELPLHLVHNPHTHSYMLPELQGILEERYKEYLKEEYGIVFNRLLVINNMPLGRFKNILNKDKKYNSYLSMLASNFNPSTLSELMCLYMININHEGKVSDCDFNNSLKLYLKANPEQLSIEDLTKSDIITGDHCYGCTALKGSGCYGSVIK